MKRTQWPLALLTTVALTACSPSNPASDAQMDTGNAPADVPGVNADVPTQQSMDALDDRQDVSSVIEDVVLGPTTARFEVPRPMIVANQFLLPWPSDLAVDGTGAVDLHFIPGVMTAELTRSYVAVIGE